MSMKTAVVLETLIELKNDPGLNKSIELIFSSEEDDPGVAYEVSNRNAFILTSDTDMLCYNYGTDTNKQIKGVAFFPDTHQKNKHQKYNDQKREPPDPLNLRMEEAGLCFKYTDQKRVSGSLGIPLSALPLLGVLLGNNYSSNGEWTEKLIPLRSRALQQGLAKRKKAWFSLSTEKSKDFKSCSEERQTSCRDNVCICRDNLHCTRADCYYKHPKIGRCFCRDCHFVTQNSMQSRKTIKDTYTCNENRCLKPYSCEWRHMQGRRDKTQMIPVRRCSNPLRRTKPGDEEWLIIKEAVDSRKVRIEPEYLMAMCHGLTEELKIVTNVDNFLAEPTKINSDIQESLEQVLELYRPKKPEVPEVDHSTNSQHDDYMAFSKQKIYRLKTDKYVGVKNKYEYLQWLVDKWKYCLVHDQNCKGSYHIVDDENVTAKKDEKIEDLDTHLAELLTTFKAVGLTERTSLIASFFDACARNILTKTALPASLAIQLAALRWWIATTSAKIPDFFSPIQKLDEWQIKVIISFMIQRFLEIECEQDRFEPHYSGSAHLSFDIDMASFQFVQQWHDVLSSIHDLAICLSLDPPVPATFFDGCFLFNLYIAAKKKASESDGDATVDFSFYRYNKLQHESAAIGDLILKFYKLVMHGKESDDNSTVAELVKGIKAKLSQTIERIKVYRPNKWL